MKLERLKNHIVRRAYPELSEEKGVHIDLRWEKMKDAHLKYDVRYFDRNYLIKVSNALKRVENIILIGGIAHELSHISIGLSYGILDTIADDILIQISPSYLTWDEREADELAIKRGYGRQLLEFLRYAYKGKDYTEKDGLTTKEVIKRMKSL